MKKLSFSRIGVLAVGLALCSFFNGCGGANEFNPDDLNPLKSSGDQNSGANMSTSLKPVPFSTGVDTYCSDNGASSTKGNVVDGAKLTLHLLDSMNAEVCTISDPNLKDNIINQRKVAIPNLRVSCPSLATGIYTLSLTADGSKNLLFGQTATEVFTNRQQLYSTGALPAYTVSINTLADPWSVLGETENGSPLVPTVMYAKYAMMSQNSVKTDGPLPCTQGASPLLLQLANVPVQLSPPTEGVWFDIFGENAPITAHAKSLISWFTPRTARGNYFIVLPSKGQVNGIDQMFGNNTRGSDGKFADNGFEALRKWDKNGDGVIDANDSIYQSLRLWSDANADGVAQAEEMFSLDQLNVVSLDLAYDSNYFESDDYGNEIRYKSIATTRDGQMHLIYDIWFRPVK